VGTTPHSNVRRNSDTFVPHAEKHSEIQPLLVTKPPPQLPHSGLHRYRAPENPLACIRRGLRRLALREVFIIPMLGADFFELLVSHVHKDAFRLLFLAGPIPCDV
jgi:hypothetical protein